MARAATTSDAFNAVAEPRRRQLLDVLAGGERSVTELIGALGLEQPQVSKHLRILREVGLVRARTEGRKHIYRLEGEPLRPIHDWVKRYEQTWDERYDRLDEVLEDLKRKEEEEEERRRMGTMTHSGKAEVTLPADTQILITREFEAPRHLVYRASTEPDLVKRWWSGKRGEVTSVEIDLRVGGRWRYVMVANDGTEVAFHGTYREIVPDERIVSTELYEGIPGATEDDATLNTVTLTEMNARTRLTTLIDCPNKMTRDAIIESGMEGGMQEAFDKLEEVARSLA